MFRVFSLRALGAAAFALSLSAPAFAQPAPTPTPSGSPAPEIAHVVTSDRSDESLARTARTTYVVTKADMLRDGDTSIADALANVPGVSLDRYGAFGAQTGLSIRGSSTRQVLVLLDGLPIAGAQIDGIDLGEYSTTGVSRVEIVEGGGSTLYGSGSVGGIVNIITAKDAKPAALVSTGSFGADTYAFESPYVSLSRTYSANDYSLPDGTTRANADGALTSGRIGYSRDLGNIQAAFTADLSDEDVGVPGTYGFLSGTARQSAINRDARLTLSDPRPHSTATLQLGDSTQELAFTCNFPIPQDDQSCPNAYLFSPPYTKPAIAPGPYASLLQDTRAMTSLRDVVGDDRSRIVYGIDLARGVARIDPGTGGPNGLDPDVVGTYGNAEAAAYVQSQWTSQNGNDFYAGLRGERDGAQGGQLSPSLGTIVRLSPELLVRANAATAFDAPSAELLYYPGYANPNLMPERLRVGDVTLVAPHVAGGVSFGWFTTGGSNLIVSNPPNYIPANVGHALISGFALDASTKRIQGYSATLDVTNLYRAEDLDDQARLTDRGPAISARLGFNYLAPPKSEFDGFGVSALTKGNQGPVDYTQQSLGPLWQQPIGYTRIDAYAGLRAGPRATLTLRGFNLGNERYAEYLGYPTPGRSFALELRTR